MYMPVFLKCFTKGGCTNTRHGTEDSMHLNQVINYKCIVPLLYFELERGILYPRTYCAVVVSFLLTPLKLVINAI